MVSDLTDAIAKAVDGAGPTHYPLLTLEQKRAGAAAATAWFTDWLRENRGAGYAAVDALLVAIGALGGDQA